MSLHKKYLKVFQAGFSAGVTSTTDNWSGGTWNPANLEDTEAWESKYKFELETAMKEFAEFITKERI